MRKEVLLAICVGLLLGLIITYGVYRARTSLQPNTLPLPLLTTQSESPVPTDTGLVLSSPIDESVQFEPEITIAGTTTPNSFITIVVQDEPRTTQADESGNFSTTAELKAGGNVIAIYAVDEDGVETYVERTVAYARESSFRSPDEEPQTASASTKTAPDNNSDETLDDEDADQAEPSETQNEER